MSYETTDPNRVTQMRTGKACKRWLRGFQRDESGVLVGFSIFLFLIILLVGGIGIDLMRSEMNRTRMQHTLDRAVLAAADMSQSLDPKSVVRDYFAKSGLSDTLTYVDDDTGLNYRVVTARAERQTKTNFMKLAGVEACNRLPQGAPRNVLAGRDFARP